MNHTEGCPGLLWMIKFSYKIYTSTLKHRSFFYEKEKTVSFFSEPKQFSVWFDDILTRVWPAYLWFVYFSHVFVHLSLR